jgi:dUTPase/gag-polyprotein putative aspartyl protease
LENSITKGWKQPKKRVGLGPKEEWSLAASQVSSKSRTNFLIPLTVITKKGEVVIVKALVDSGAEKSFVDEKFVATFKMKTKKVKNPMNVRLADGSLSQVGIIDREINLSMLMGPQHYEQHTFHIMSVGGSTLILGLDWLKKHQPTINFKDLEIDFQSEYCSKTCIQHHLGPTTEIAEVIQEMPLCAITNSNQLLVKRTSEKAKIPTRGSKGTAGLDIYSAEKTMVPPESQMVIATDLEIALPIGTYGRLAPRSGLAAKQFIGIGGGVIDRDY